MRIIIIKNASENEKNSRDSDPLLCQKALNRKYSFCTHRIRILFLTLIKLPRSRVKWNRPRFQPFGFGVCVQCSPCIYV